MSEIQEGVFITIVIFLIAMGITVSGFYTIKFYWHYFSNHILYTKRYFHKLNLKLIEIRQPSYTDWVNNPFQQKNIHLLDAIFPPSFLLRDHKIILVTDQSETEIQIFWRQVNTILFAKGKIEFLKQSENSTQEIIQEFSKNIVLVNETCPACGKQIGKIDSECSNCGLVFKTNTKQ